MATTNSKLTTRYSFLYKIPNIYDKLINQAHYAGLQELNEG